MEIKEVALAVLKPNPHQIRRLVDEDADRELQASIDSRGLIQPIVITPDRNQPGHYIVVAGERRYRAFIQLKKATIPAIVTEGDTDEIALLENVQRQNLHPLEEAFALHHLQQKHNYMQEQLSEVIGKPRSSIAQLLRLVELPREIQDECSTSDIAKSLLIEIATIEETERQLVVWEHVKRRQMTVRAVRAMKEEMQHRPVPSRRQPARTDAVLHAGRGFLEKLTQFVKSEIPAECGWFDELRNLTGQITGCVQEIADRVQITWDVDQEEALPEETIKVVLSK